MEVRLEGLQPAKGLASQPQCQLPLPAGESQGQGYVSDGQGSAGMVTGQTIVNIGVMPAHKY